MTTTDFALPVTGITGTAFRNSLSNILAAVASTNESAGEPPVTYPGMLQVKTTTGVSSLRVRNAANSGWQTLLPDVSQQYGGIPLINLGSNNVFTGTNTFNGTVTFAAVPAGIASDAELANAIATRTTPSDVSNSINAAVAGLPIYRAFENSFNPSLGSITTFSHGFGINPRVVSCEAVFQVATLGFAVGDIVEVNAGVSLRKSTTQVEVIVGSTGIPIIRRDTFASFTIVNMSDISLRVRAYA